ncbi:MAG: YbhB/YbcL family Raf kinase inhibitor-like protein, partial [Thermoproteus sp.]
MRRVAVIISIVVVVAVVVLLALYYSGGRTPAAVQSGAKIYVASPAFANGSTIPAQYTCDGPDVSPQLEWSGVPKGAKSLLVVMVDPDAPGGQFIHWVLYNVPPNATG